MKKLFKKLYGSLKKMKYAFYSENNNIYGFYSAHQPVLCNGLGKLVFGDNVNIGVIKSPLFLNSYAYIEARTKDSQIIFGNNIHINNAFSAIAEISIEINDNVLIGFNCQIIDSNFHDLDAEKRQMTDPNPKAVIIEKNVFIGNNVTILKGVTIGENSVIASGTVVKASVPANVVFGNPSAKVLRELS